MLDPTRMFPQSTSGGTTSDLSGTLQGLGGIYGLLTANQTGKQYAGLGQQAAATADPFASQRPYYQGILQNLVQNPSSFTSSAPVQAALNLGSDALTRQAAATGNLGSGNIGFELQKYGTDTAQSMFLPYMQQLGLLAGAQTGQPGAAGQLKYTGGTTGLQAGPGGIMQGLANVAPNFGSMLNTGKSIYNWLTGTGGGGGTGGDVLGSGAVDAVPAGGMQTPADLQQWLDSYTGTGSTATTGVPDWTSFLGSTPDVAGGAGQGATMTTSALPDSYWTATASNAPAGIASDVGTGMSTGEGISGGLGGTETAGGGSTAAAGAGLGGLAATGLAAGALYGLVNMSNIGDAQSQAGYQNTANQLNQMGIASGVNDVLKTAMTQLSKTPGSSMNDLSATATPLVSQYLKSIGQYSPDLVKDIVGNYASLAPIYDANQVQGLSNSYYAGFGGTTGQG